MVDNSADPPGGVRLPVSWPLALLSLSRARPTTVAIDPTAAEEAALADVLGVVALRNLALEGQLSPWGEEGWQLDAVLRGEVEQRCVVSLEPVVTSIDLRLDRRFLPEGDDALAPPADPEAEMPVGGEAAPEPVGAELDLAAVALGALALELDPWPRAEGATFGNRVHGPPGADPMTEEAMRPFAGLAGLRDRLKPRTDPAD